VFIYQQEYHFSALISLSLYIPIYDSFLFIRTGAPAESLPVSEICKSQESKLAVLWTVGIFALNFGPVLMGFVLDYLGPKITAIIGVFLNMLGLILFAVSSSSGTNAFVAAAIILGLGNITFHLAQFHISALFPRKRGLISSIFVAGFTGSAIIMYFLLLIFQSSGSTTNAYQAVLLGYAGICALWIPLVAWMMPNDSFRVGMVYLLRNDWKFEVRQLSDMDRQYRRATTLQDFVAAASAAGGTNGAVAGTAALYGQDVDVDSNRTHVGAGLVSGNMPDSSDPAWNLPSGGGGGGGDGAEEQRRQRQLQQQQQWGGINNNNGITTTTTNSYSQQPVTPTGVNLLHQDHPSQAPHPLDNDDTHHHHHHNNNDVEASSSPTAQYHQQQFGGFDGSAVGPESMPLPPDVSWGPLVFEARHFVELRKKSFKEQFLSAESFGMGVFYTLNVFFLQFYLGTQRLQLDYKGDYNNAYANFGNVVVAFAFVAVPVIGWLLDKKGYGWTLGSINALAVLTSVFQALPMLWIQSLTLIVWMVARFFMYSSYFAIFGGLFGFRNFGRLVAIDNTFNGLFGLLQYPLTYLGIHALDGNFTVINVGQAVVLLPLFVFCYYMGKWEREDLVPIRPLEGEELPFDMMGARERKALPQLPHMHLPHIELPHLRGGNRRVSSTSEGI
jgi:MFS family permease